MFTISGTIGGAADPGFPAPFWKHAYRHGRDHARRPLRSLGIPDFEYACTDLQACFEHMGSFANHPGRRDDAGLVG